MARKTSPSQRFLKLAGMTASIASKTVTNTIKYRNADEEQKLEAKSELYKTIGLQIADTLGQMKGAAMKVGQIASQYKDMLPPEMAEAFAQLQRQAPPMPFEQIKSQIEKELKQPLDKLFQQFESTPFAAASIGQVHRAILNNGQAVVVKVQYPGVDEACDSDLKQLRLALRLTGMLKIDRQLQDELFEEIRDSLYNELNYEIEAQNLTVFRTFHAKLDPQIIIPTVYPDYSTRRILTLSEEKGDALDTAAAWPLELRNRLGRRLFQALGQEIFYLKRFHCDPHPGNFAFRADGSVIIYDYGGVKTVTDQTIRDISLLIEAALDHKAPQIDTILRRMQIRTDRKEIPDEFYLKWVEILTRPVLQQYDFAENSAHHDGVELAKRAMKYWDCFQPSSETLMINRTVSGHYWNLVQLKVHDNYSDLFSQLVPKVSN